MTVWSYILGKLDPIPDEISVNVPDKSAGKLAPKGRENSKKPSPFEGRYQISMTDYRMLHPVHPGTLSRLGWWRERQTDGRTEREADRRTDEQTDGRRDRQTDGRTDGQETGDRQAD